METNLLYNGIILHSPHFGQPFAASLFPGTASHQVHELRCGQDETQATTEGIFSKSRGQKSHLAPAGSGDPAAGRRIWQSVASVHRHKALPTPGYWEDTTEGSETLARELIRDHRCRKSGPISVHNSETKEKDNWLQDFYSNIPW